MIFVPLLHYFKCKNQYSGNEDGMRYLLSPGKRSVPDPDGGEGAQKEEAILTVDIWPDPWALGRAAAAEYLSSAYSADLALWKQRPSILDCEPWSPPPKDEDAESGESK